jgi:hypothetical protein
MFKADALEAQAIAEVVLVALLGKTPSTGIPGSTFRMAVNTFRANAVSILMADAAGPPLENIFRLAVTNNISYPQAEYVLNVATNQTPATPGGTLIRDSLVQYILAAEGLIISGMTFVSRDDVDAMLQTVQAAFAPVDEALADGIDPMAYRAVISLQAAIVYFLTQNARPLPRMLNFVFARPLPTLLAAYKLYADASRADELLAENKVVHPLFMKPTGRALSQ